MKKLFSPLLILIFGTVAIAQNNVGINTISPDASAALDVSSTSQGMLVPRMTKAQRDVINLVGGVSTPATGLLIWQTDNTPGFYFNAGTSSTPNWIQLGAKGDSGSAGPKGDTGNSGAAGPGVPTGGTSGQVLAKVDGTNYNTQWTTPGGGGNLQLIANKINGTGESIPVAVTTSPTTIVFNNLITSPSLGTYDNTTGVFTVGSNGAGVYMIQARVHGNDASPTTNTVSYCLNIQINNAAWGSQAGIIYGIYTPLNVYTPAGTKARGEITSYVKLNAGDNFKIVVHGTNSSVAPQNLIPDAGCNLMVMKMN